MTHSIRNYLGRSRHTLRHRCFRLFVQTTIILTLFSSARLSYLLLTDVVQSPPTDVASAAHYVSKGDVIGSTRSRVDRELARGIAACPHRRRPVHVRHRNGAWQVSGVAGEGDYEIVVYSAFLDDRPVVGVTPWLRVLGVVGKRVMTAKKTSPSPASHKSQTGIQRSATNSASDGGATSGQSPMGTDRCPQYQNVLDTPQVIHGTVHPFDNGSDSGVPIMDHLHNNKTNFGDSGRNASSAPIMYCQVWFSGIEAPFVTAAQLVYTGRRKGFRVNVAGDYIEYIQYLISCRLPGIEPVPDHVSLVTDCCGQSTILLPVQRPVRAPPDHEFGVCVAIAFNHVPVADFVEWIELNRLLGVGEFNIYYAGEMIDPIKPVQKTTSRNSADIHKGGNSVRDNTDSVNASTPDVKAASLSDLEAMRAAFEYYSKLGVLRLFDMPPPVEAASTREAVKLSSPASLNDCALRNVYRYGYAIIIDFDEVIVPRIDDTYAALLQRVDKQHRLLEPHFSYTFQNVYFFDHLPTDPSAPAHMRTLLRRTHMPPNGRGYAAKSFIDPRQCLSVFNHYCYVQFPLSSPGRQKLRTPVFVDAVFAASHHYRFCNLRSAPRCDEYEKQRRTIDDVTLRFAKRTKPAVERVLTDLHMLTSDGRLVDVKH